VLLAELDRVRAERDGAFAECEALCVEVADLKRRLEAAERAGKRQAAPFRKGPPRRGPSRPVARRARSTVHTAIGPRRRRIKSTSVTKRRYPTTVRIVTAH